MQKLVASHLISRSIVSQTLVITLNILQIHESTSDGARNKCKTGPCCTKLGHRVRWGWYPRPGLRRDCQGTWTVTALAHLQLESLSFGALLGFASRWTVSQLRPAANPAPAPYRSVAAIAVPGQPVSDRSGPHLATTTTSAPPVGAESTPAT